MSPLHQTIAITGASSGLGAALARSYARTERVLAYFGQPDRGTEAAATTGAGMRRSFVMRSSKNHGQGAS